MLTIRLVQMIEDHAEELTQGLIKDLRAIHGLRTIIN